MTGLTQKQEAFCLAYMETGNASEAYRRAYDAEKMKPETVNRKAKEVMDNGKVTARIAELRKGAEDRNAVTVDSLIAELDETRQVALSAQTPQTSAAVAATMGKAKLLGFDISKTELTGKNGNPLFGGDPKELTDEQLAHIATAGSAGTAG